MKWLDVSSGKLGPVGLPVALQRDLELVLYRIAFMCVRCPPVHCQCTGGNMQYRIALSQDDRWIDITTGIVT